MSEINSIAQGTYTLGQTSATTYQAGPGISITQPSEGTVRISNDETVLWSGLLNTNNATANLSESITHFKYIQVEGYTHNGVQFPWVTKLPVNGNNAIYGVGLNQWKDVTKELDMSRFKVDGTVITCMEATWIIPAGNWGSTTSNITKVIGINHISGSNA